MKNNKLLCSLLFVLASLLSYSQDLILKQDSSVIFCKIVKEDSISIYYRQTKGEQTTESNIFKIDVLTYYNRSALIKNEIKRNDSLALVQAKKDSVQPKATSLLPKKDTVLVKKDTLQTKAVAIKPPSDTIFLNSNYKCFYKTELITKKEALILMKGNTEAHREMKIARSYFAPVIPLGIGAAVSAVVFIADAVGPGNFHWVVGGSCIIAAVFAITWKHYSNIHLYNAVRLYNAKIGMAVTSIPKFELGMASKGVGLCLKF